MATTRSRKGRPSLYVRVSVPRNLRTLIGRSEIVKSLDTTDSAIGKLRAGLVTGKTARLFLFIQQQGHSMTTAQLRTLVSRYITERLDEWEEATYSPDGMDALRNGGQWQDSLTGFAQSAVDDCVAALRSNDVTAIAPVVDEFVQRYGLDITKDSPQYKTLARELLKAEAVIAGKVGQRVQGVFGAEYVDGCGEPRSARLEQVATPSTQATKPYLLADAIRAYLDNLARVKQRAPGTLESKKNILTRFLGYIGNRPVHTILRDDCIAYRDTIAKLPAHASKRFPGLSLMEVLEKAKSQPGIQLLSKQTVTQDLTHIGAFFAYLIDAKRYQGTIPTERLGYEGLEPGSYEMFTDSDLKTVFGSEEFKRQKQDPVFFARYWLLLILLYTGARREEIANLALADVGLEDGCPFFDITPDSARGRRLKTQASKRRVPVHSHLVKLGLLKYVEARRNNGETLLFSKKAKGGRMGRATVGDGVSKWFHRLLKRLKVPGSKCIHGLRSTVTTKLYEAGVDGETRRRLLGHAGKDEHEARYLRPPVKVLREHLERLDFSAALR